MSEFYVLGSYYVHSVTTMFGYRSEQPVTWEEAQLKGLNVLSLHLNGEEDVPFSYDYSNVVVEVVGPGSIKYLTESQGCCYPLILKDGVRVSYITTNHSLCTTTTFVGTVTQIQESMDSLNNADDSGSWLNDIEFRPSDSRTPITIVHHDSQERGEDIVRLPPFDTGDIFRIAVGHGRIPVDTYAYLLEKGVSEIMMSNTNP